MTEIDAERCSPLFIVGCGRSGTTMLREMINAHPEYAIPGESHFIPELWRRRGAYARDRERNVEVDRLVQDIVSIPQVRKWKVPHEYIWRRIGDSPVPTFASVIESVFQAYADSRAKRSWGDKTPVYVLHIPLLSELFPRARFIHIIRDGRDVALSYLSRPLSVHGIWQAGRRWRRDVGAGLRHGRRLPSGRYTEVRYEDLVTRPEVALQQLSGFARIPYTEEMLDYPDRYREKKRTYPNPTGLHEAVTKPPTPGLRDWRSQMPDDDILAFEAVAGPLLSELGYERRHPSIPPSVRVEATLRLAGIGLRTKGGVAKKRVTRAIRARRAGARSA